jgi:malate dehydrogenase (oxaloacetate-decarboxylating)
MIMAAAKTLSSLSPAAIDSSAPLLPPIGDSRKVALAVAEAVARQAIAEGISGLSDPDTLPGTLKDQLRKYVWEPVYRPYEHVDCAC